MPDLDQLRDLADQVRPPAFGALTETARRRDRRAAAGLATALVVLAVVVLSGIVTTRDERTSPQPARPSPSTDVRAVPGSGEKLLDVGRYALRVTPDLGYEVDVPGPRYVDEGRYLHHPDAAGVFVVTPAPADGTVVPRHPCRDKTGVPIGPSPQDLARALAAQPVLDVRDRTPVTLGGAHGVYLEIRVPRRFDATGCQDVGETTDDLEMFATTTGDRWSWTSGYLARWWILDVAGERVVVMNHCELTCSAEALAALRGMALSVRFRPGAENDTDGD
jgi:hypothetical protein